MKRRARNRLVHFKTRKSKCSHCYNNNSNSLMMNCWSSVVLLAAVAFVLAEAAEAKRGCATFGHSCYGGMGKRASELIDNNEEILQDVQGDENPAFVFTGPRSEYKPERPPKLTPQQYDNISRVIRQWIQYYRRAQEMHADNNNI